MRQVFIIVCLMSVTSQSVGAELTVSDMSIQTLINFIQAEKIRSVESLMPRLPVELRQTFALVEDSHSRQRPSSALYPRIIMFAPDGSFFLTVATAKRSKAYDDIEMLEFKDDKTWEIERYPFDKTVFNGDLAESTPYRDNVPDNQQCVGCHGSQKRPIWGRYPTWPAVFGDEAAQKLNLRQARKLTQALQDGHNGRLKLLHWVRLRSGLDRYDWRPADATDANLLPRFELPAYYDNGSAALLNDAIFSRQTEHLWHRIRAEPDYQVLMLAYLFLEDSTFLANVSQQHHATVEVVKGELREIVDAAFDPNRTPYTGRDWGDKILLTLNLDPYNDLLLSHARKDYNDLWKPSERGFGEDWGPGGDAWDAAFDLLEVNELIAQFPELEEHFRRIDYGYPHYDTLNDYRLGMTWWLWEATLEERIQVLKAGRSHAERLRHSQLFPDVLQDALVGDLLDAARTIIDASTIRKKAINKD